MCKIKLFISVLFLVCIPIWVQAAERPEVQRVHPSFWWAGMENSQLQILLYGTDLGSCEVRLSASDLKIDRIVRPVNSHYLLLYVDVQGAGPQQFDILLQQGKRTLRVPYELKARQSMKRQTFDASDVVYLLMPDRFANGNRQNDKVEGMRETECNVLLPDARHGGDIAGIRQHLDYFTDLGVTAIWSTPLLENDVPACSYHGYGITDYYRIDPRYGSNVEYKEMVEAAHAHGLKVIMDMVFNHCSSSNFLFADRPDDNWFNYNSRYVQTTYKIGAISDVHASESNLRRAQDGWFVEVMPDFNQKNPDVLTYLIQNSIWWIEYAGIDGIRQDTYPYADFEAMASWCQAVDRQYPGFNIVGETWVNHNVGISYWQKGSRLAAPRNSQLPSVMDFPLMSLLNTALDEETNEWDRGLARIYDYLSQDMVYADPLHLLTFLDNHDTDRFASSSNLASRPERYRQALTLLLTLRGIPQLYYGDEIAMFADKSKGDGALRQDFPGGFDDQTVNAFTQKGLTPERKAQFDFARRLLHWRKGNVAVAYGKLKHYAVRNGVYVYSRQYQGKTVTIFMNGTSQSQTIDLSDYCEVIPQTEAYEVISGQQVQLGDTLSLSPRGIQILDFNR